MYVIVTGEYSDWQLIGYVKTEEEAIQYCLDGRCYYQQIDKIKVNEKIMKQKRYTKVGICFRTNDLIEWTNTDIRKYYSDKPFEDVENIANLKFGWILLEHLSEDVEKSIKILNDKFSFIKYEINLLNTLEEKYLFLKEQGINQN